ncbi:unnamed protein product [Bursaphelenchus xylophilus]|uniref:(pine wood nematode) hypothetical protein n=1 Tax=Bursaphelenchus xylophilus TaxID=6326 RepID=A0A1I7SF61_BURXY|nr:unnamed protein product [Bursaphelenchus xylophilus]CAG9078723.1 unnamed protein product [Bursaphelenchus xylophilus]
MEVDSDRDCFPQEVRLIPCGKTFFGGKIPFQLYKSPSNGLHLGIARSNSKAVDVNVTLATDPGYGDGVALATAKMSLLGGRSCSSVNFIPQLAANCFCPNKRTLINISQSHTSFTFRTLSESAFLNFLTALYSSLLFPEFTDEKFLNEIYKIAEFSHESGCLFEELLGTEHHLTKLMDEQKTRILFEEASLLRESPVGSCNSVRTFLTLDSIKAFHSQYYKPSNIFITVVGNVNSYDIPLFNSLTFIPDPNPIERPFCNLEIPNPSCHYENVTKVAGLSQTGEPSVVLGFLGGNARDITTLTAAEVFANYLCKFSSLQSEFLPEYAASIEVKLKVLPRWEISVEFDGVPSEKTNMIAEKFLGLVRAREFIDHSRIELAALDLIHENQQRIAQDTFQPELFERIRRFQQYSLAIDDEFALARNLNPHVFYEHHAKQPNEAWTEFVTEWFNENCAVLVGLPTNASETRMDPCFQEHIRISCEMEKYANQSEIFEKAERAEIHLLEHHAGPNENVKTSVFPTQLPFKAHKTWIIEADTKRLPKGIEAWKKFLNVQSIPTIFHEIEENKSGLSACFNIRLDDFEPNLLNFVPLLIKLLQNSAVSTPEGRLLKEEVLRIRLDELQSWSTKLVNHGKMGMVMIEIKPKENNIELVSKWFHHTLIYSVFSQDEVKSSIQQLLYESVKASSDLSALNSVILNHVQLDSDDVRRRFNPVLLENFHLTCLNRIIDEPQALIDELELIRKKVINSPINLHIIGGLDEIKLEKKMDFADFLKKRSDNCETEVLQMRFPTSTPFHWGPTSETRLLAKDNLPARSSLFERAHYKTERFSETHAAILIVANYASMPGGIFWTELVKIGAANALELKYSVEDECLELKIEGSYELRAIREEVSEKLKRICEGRNVDEFLFESAKKTSVTEIIENYYENYNEQLINDFINNIKEHDLLEFISKVLSMERSQATRLAFSAMYKIVLADNPRSVVCAEWNISNEDWTSRGAFRTTASKIDISDLLC